MRITKFGHSCLLVEETGTKILIDPGVWSTGFEDETGINAILITHEHQDHFYPECLYKIMAQNPSATVITNSGTAELVKKAGIPYRILDPNQTTVVNTVSVEGFGYDHQIIHSSIPLIRNTGYLVGERLFHPGDSYTVPSKQVEILAMPIAAPWLKTGDAIDFTIKVKPKISFPIHDAILNEQGEKLMQGLPEKMLTEAGVEWVVIKNGESKEFSQ